MFSTGSRFPKIFLLAIILFVAGCTVISDIISPREEEDTIDTSALATWWNGPRVKTGVALRVQVGSGAMVPVVMTVVVDQKGEIVLPHLLQEPVLCEDLTLDALRSKLTKAYKVYYRHPQVTVDFAPYDGTGVSPWGTITVLGEVASPGPVNMPPTMNMTVSKVIQAAGGLRQYADKTKIQVTRCESDGKKKKYNIDLVEIGKNGRADKDMVLRPGDVVWVPVTWY